MNRLSKILAQIDDAQEVRDFLQEILTQKEQRDVRLRWQLLEELYDGKPQRSIAKKTRNQSV